MKEYIKKFATAAAANNYLIEDIPFTTTVVCVTPQNLVCNEEGMKLVNDGGTVTVESAGPALINFSISNLVEEQTAEDGMTWTQWINSDYNHTWWRIYNGRVVYEGGAAYDLYYDMEGEEYVYASDQIEERGYYAID